MKYLLFPLLLLGVVRARESCRLTYLPGEVACSNVEADALPIKEVLNFEDDIPGFTLNLRRLEFHDSKINSIRKNTFKLLPRLSQIVLSNISLETIDIAAFQGITRLKSLDLSYNKFTTLHRDMFKGIVLLHLKLDGNPNLEKPINGPFLNAPWLNSLSLKKCNITHLPGSAFSKTPELKTLILSHNYLQQLPVDIFKHLSLTHLDLSHNKFQTINPFVFRQIRGYPQFPNAVILDGNNWRCDCDLVDFIKWASEDAETNIPTKAYEESRLRKETVCASPENRKGSPWMLYQEWNCIEQYENQINA